MLLHVLKCEFDGSDNHSQLAGSCINFPDGNQDDIVALGALAAAYNVGLHVDCCLGSFIVSRKAPLIFRAGDFQQ